MSKDQHNSVIINGRKYDARTGLPVQTSENSNLSHTTRSSLRKKQESTKNSTKSHAVIPAHKMHQRSAQKSTTLRRKYTKKPHAIKNTPAAKKPATVQATQASQNTTPNTSTTIQVSRPQKRQRIDAIRPPQRAQQHSPQLSPVQQTKKTLQPLDSHAKKSIAQTTPHPNNHDKVQPHPVVQRAHTIQSNQKQSHTKQQNMSVAPSNVIKNAVINEAMTNAPVQTASQHKKRLSPLKSRIAGIILGCSALLLFGGYLTYLNVPNLSVRVAAAQAGIDASYPGYRPDGYRLNGPITFKSGQVKMDFTANAGNRSFSINQSKSSWDSLALLENYVKENYGNSYLTTQNSGMTIYTYDGKAAWVNGGILYTIDGDAPLTNGQIQKIATSIQ